MRSAECVAKTSNILGESPLWSPYDNRLYWLDILEPAVYSYCPSSGETRSYRLPEITGSFCLRNAPPTDTDEKSSPGWLLAMKSGVYSADFGFSTFIKLLELEPDKPDNRPNDGKCDRQGRFWVSTMPAGDRVPSGSLYCIDQVQHYRQVFHRLTVPNSLAWSPDGKTMYFADTPELRILRYDYDVDEGVPSNPQVFHTFDPHRGKPDGSTVDIDGCLWNAEVHASRVVRYTPEGKVELVVELPVSKVTSCAFGGPDLKTLFITTAQESLTPEQLRDQPLAGGLFAIETNTAGILETPASF